MLPLLPMAGTTDQVVDLVCSEDPAVTLRFVPAPPLSDDEKAAGKTPADPVREARRPIRWLTREEVETVGPDALVVGVRLVNSDEQFEACGGFHALTTREGMARAAHRVSSICVRRVTGPGVDARDPAEVRAFLPRLPMLYREELGEWVLYRSTGLRDPFGSPP